MGNWGPMYYFSACITSKISQLKFKANKFGRVQWSRKLDRLKRIRGLGHPISPSGHHLSFPIARVSNLPITSSKAPPKCSIASSRAQFSIFLIRSFIPPQFSNCFIKGLQFPTASSKGPKFSIAPSIKGPQFPHHVIKMMTCNFSSRYQGSPIVTSNFPSRYQGVPIYFCIIKGPHFPHRVIKGTQFSKIHHVGLCNL